jgi:enamine deaminase RidA (YjgF/YER057c/UK114 family)
VAHDTVNPSTVFRSLDHGFSQGTVATGRRTLFVSGQTAWDEERRLIGGADLAAQATHAFANVRAVVEAAGATIDDVVMVRIYVVDYRPEHAGAVGGAFREVFADVAPACSWIGVAALADPAFLIEVEAVAMFD